MQRRGRPKGRPKTGGRQKGTPNVMTASIKSALTEAFDGLGGVPALVDWGKDNPTPFYLCWSRLAPKEAPEGGSGLVHIGQLHLDALRAPRHIEAVTAIPSGGGCLRGSVVEEPSIGHTSGTPISDCHGAPPKTLTLQSINGRGSLGRHDQR